MEEIQKPQTPGIDGLDSLLRLPMKCGNLSDYILENTIFFLPYIVDNDCFYMNKPFYVRRSNQYEYFKDNNHTSQVFGDSKILNTYGPLYPLNKNRYVSINFDVPIIVDRDGNKFIRDLIKQITGHVVSQGPKNNTINNYTIAHIWAQTDNPYFFGFLWNVCLIPNWAAFISDKNVSSYKANSDIGCFINSFQNTLKSVACSLYSKDVVKGAAPVPLINVKDKKVLLVDSYGKIFKYKIGTELSSSEDII